MSKNLYLMSQKGGVGKSTATYHLVEQFRRDFTTDDGKCRISYIDADGQGSIIEPFTNDPCDVKIVDTPGHIPDADVWIGWIKDADVIVVPTLPTRLNMEPYLRMREMLAPWEKAGKKVITLINQYNPNYVASQHFYEWYRSQFPQDITVALNQSEIIKQAAEYKEGIISESHLVGRQLKHLYDVCCENLFGSVRRV